MQIDYECGRALLYDVLDNMEIDPDEELLARAWAAVFTVMENANHRHRCSRSYDGA
jgi:hypothetical protein